MKPTVLYSFAEIFHDHLQQPTNNLQSSSQAMCQNNLVLDIFTIKIHLNASVANLLIESMEN